MSQSSPQDHQLSTQSERRQFKRSDSGTIKVLSAISASSKLVRLLQNCWRWCCRVALVQPSLRSYLEPLIRLLQPTFRAHLHHAAVVECKQQGNFLQLTLKPEQRWQGFIPGQHLQLVLELAGRAVSRTFSISSSLQEYQQHGHVRLTIQQQQQGLLTPHLHQYLKGSTAAKAGSATSSCVHLSAASGDFVLQHQQQPIFMLAAGSGITPIHAILMSMTRLTQPLLLIYSFRGVAELLFADSWSLLQQRFPLLQVQLIDTTCRERLQSAELSAWLTDKPDSQIFLCGPSAFSQHWLQQLALLHVPKSQIRQESFGFVATASQGDAKSSQQIAVEQAAQRLTLQSSNGSLLLDLEAAGLNPRYGCRRGICMQCLCQKNQGVVRNLLSGEISDTGPGQIQLCISQPLSAVELKLLN